MLLIAPAGYGKSTALDDYCGALGGDIRRFEGSAERCELLANVGEALNGFEGTIAIDSLDCAPLEVVQAFASAIERTKSRIRWIISSRSSVGLPIGAWLAYGDCDLAIGTAELRFTAEEAAELARTFGLAIDDENLRDILDFADGWPVAMNVAFRTIARPDQLEIRTEVRDAGRQFFSEQVYASLDEGERSLLSVAAALPEIDVRVLDLAGFDNALQLIEALRAGTGLLYEETPGFYRSSEPFLDFLRHQTALLGSSEYEAVHLRAARALEKGGNIEAALRAYVTARSNADVLRLLETKGFDLLERGRSEATSRAINALDDAIRRTSPRILALRGVLQSLAGNPVRAEVLLRQALSRAQGDRDLAGFAALRLAPLMANYGGDVVTVLNPVANDTTQPVEYRAEAMSLLATTHAIAGEIAAAKAAVADVESLLVDIDLDSTRARILQRVGVAAMYAYENERARQTLMQAADLSTELNLYSIASRAWSALSNLMCHAYDDVMSQLWYAERAASNAIKSGDSLELQTALMQVAAAEMRRGNAEESSALEEQLIGLRSDPTRAYLLVAFKATRLAWEGRFDEAHRELAVCWYCMHHDFDRLICGAQCALFLALDGHRQSSISLLSEVTSLSETVRPDGLFRRRYVALALLFCVVAEVVNERATCAKRIIRRIGSDSLDPVVLLATRTAEEFTSPKGGVWLRPEILVAMERLAALGYADVARVLEAVCSSLEGKKWNTARPDLTKAELMVLRLLGEGLSTKEIAERDGRSVNTIRAHVANAIGKLECHGRAQALALARRLEIIP